MHQVEPLVDVAERQGVVIMGSIWILPSMYQSTILGRRCSPFPAEGRALPHTPCDQLEGWRVAISARRGDTDHDAHPPARWQSSKPGA